jgi:hypothetical protein
LISPDTFQFHMNFRIHLSIYKEASHDFGRDGVKSEDQLGEKCHINNS